MRSSADPAYTVVAAKNAMRAVLFLSRHTRGVRMVEVARALEINVSTCHNILRTLRDAGVVAYDSGHKTYGIGLALINAVSGVIDRGDALTLIKPRLQALADAHRMTAILSEVASPTAIRMLSSATPAGAMGLQVPEGMEVPLLAGAMGRVVAATRGLSLAELRLRFNEVPRDKTIRFEDFLHDTQTAAAEGWAVDEGTYQLGIWGIAVAVPSRTPLVQKILCLAGAAETMPPDRTHRMAADLITAARAIAEGGVEFEI